MQGMLGIIWVMLIMAYSFAQLIAGYTGVEYYYGGMWAGIALGVALIMRFTLPVTIGSFYCAMEVWGWHWGLAALFAAPGLAFVVPGVLFSIIDGIRK